MSDTLNLKAMVVNSHQTFPRDFEAALCSWQKAGNKLIVFIDMNENHEMGAIDVMLHSEGLDMVEATCTRHPTFVRGNRAGKYAVVDGCYVTPDLIIKKVV